MQRILVAKRNFWRFAESEPLRSRMCAWTSVPEKCSEGWELYGRAELFLFQFSALYIQALGRDLIETDAL